MAVEPTESRREIGSLTQLSWPLYDTMLTNPPIPYDLRQHSVLSVLNVKVVVAAFNQEKALVGAFSVIVKLHRLIVYSTSFHVTRHQVVALDVTLAVTTIVSVSGDAVSGECHEPAHNKCLGSDFKRSEAFCSSLPSTKWLTHLADCSAQYSDSEY